MRKLTLILFMLGSLDVLAQYTKDAMFGIRAGVNMTKATNVSQIFISEGYYSGYTFEGKPVASPTASLFMNYKLPGTSLGLEARISYSNFRSKTEYNDIHGLQYTVESSFHSIGAAAYLKTYAWQGLYVGAGIGYAWNLTPDKWSYTSNSGNFDWGESEIPSDQETANEIAEIINGNNVVYAPFSIGYEFNNGLSVEAQYMLGINDMMATNTNKREWAEEDNRLRGVALTVGWALPIENPDKRRH